MKKNIKEKLDKLQRYGEFYAKSDVDDKIKLEELDKTGEISEFGRNFSPFVEEKHTMIVTDRRSYLLENLTTGSDFAGYMENMAILENEKFNGLRDSFEYNPAKTHLYTHRGDLLEDFNEIYDEQLEKIGREFGETYEEVNETIKNGSVDLSDYPDLERAFSKDKTKVLDEAFWDIDHSGVKYDLEQAKDYLSNKGFFDVEKHKYVGADLKTVNDGSLLDGLAENISIPESEKVAGVYDKDAIEIKEQDLEKLFEIQAEILDNIKNNEAKEEYKLSEEVQKRLDDNNLKRSFNELTGEYTLYSTIPDKNGNEVELISYFDYNDSPAMIHHVMEDVEDFNNFKSQMDIVRMLKTNDEYKNCKVDVSDIGYMESPLRVELDRGKLRNSKLTFLVDNDGDNVNLKTQINESYTTILNMDALFDGKLSGRDLTNMNGFTRAKDDWEFTGELLFQMCDNNDMEHNSEYYEFGYSDYLIKKDSFRTEEFEKACSSDDFIDKEFELFDEHSRNIEYFNTLSSAFFGDPTKVEKFLVENHLIPEEIVKDNEVTEQDFINAVNNITNKEQDNTLEM